MYDLSYSMGSKSKWAAWHWISPWDWITICAKWCWCLISNDDGDSFHLGHGKFTYIFEHWPRKEKTNLLVFVAYEQHWVYNMIFVLLNQPLSACPINFGTTCAMSVDVRFPTYTYAFVGAFLHVGLSMNGGFRAKSHAWGEPHASPQQAAFELKKSERGWLNWTRMVYIQIYQPSFC